MGLYWVDFKYRKAEVRVSLEAESKEDATLLAKRCVKKGSKYIKTVCVR